MKLPRDVSSERLIRHLERHWAYAVNRQSGSHIVVESDSPVKHSVPIPQRKALGTGLFRAILAQISKAKGVAVEDLLRNF